MGDLKATTSIKEYRPTRRSSSKQ